MNELPYGFVKYTLKDGKERPFLIVQAWNPNLVNGILFIDGLNDYQSIPNFWLPFDPRDHPSTPVLTIWKTSIKFSGENLPDTWHY